jgi:cell division protein FtsA
MTDYLVAIDLGTTKVVSIVGEKSDDNKIKILAYNEAPSAGIRYGQVENIQKVVEVVNKTLKHIRSSSDISEIKEVYVGIAGLHIRYLENRTMTLRHEYNKLITEEEIKTLKANARRLHVNAGEEIINVIPQSYCIDDVDDITDPVGRLGHKLAGNFVTIIEKGDITLHTGLCIERLGLSLKEFILEPLASAAATLYETEKEMGVAMIDIGGGTTDMIIIKNNTVKHIAIIPLGGNAITQDIKAKFKIVQRHAEIIKIQCGSCISAKVPGNKIIEIPGVKGRESRKIKFKDLAQTIEIRMAEIISMVSAELRRYADELNAGIVLTGGGSLLTDLSEFVETKTGLSVRIGSPIHVSETSDAKIIHPKYSTAVGLLICGFDSRQNEKKLQPTVNPDNDEKKINKDVKNPDDRDDVHKPKQSMKEIFKNLFYIDDDENEKI